MDELVALYHSCHLVCYPSWGEGFGLTPLQAMATGMPVLITRGWAPYEYLLPEESLISSALVDSPWQVHHPGKMFRPDEEELRHKLRWHFENREQTSNSALELVDSVRRDYDWLDLTRKAFEHLL